MYHFQVFPNLPTETLNTQLAISVFFFSAILLEFLPYIKLRNLVNLQIKWTGKCKVKRIFQLKEEKVIKENL